MMRMVIDRHNFVRFGDACYDKARAYGFDALCFSMADTTSRYFTLPAEESDALLYREVENAKKAGLSFTNCHGPWCVPWPDETEEGLQKKIEDTKRAIHNTRVLGARFCVVHPLLPVGITDTDPALAEKTRRVNREGMCELLAAAKKEDVTLCLENMPWFHFSLATPRDILAMVEEMDDPHFQMCLDTGHANIFKELKIGDVVRETAPHLRVLHVHDNFYQMDLHLYPFAGRLDWRAFATALKQVGYDYVFELETGPSAALPDELFDLSMRLLKGSADYAMSLAE